MNAERLPVVAATATLFLEQVMLAVLLAEGVAALNELLEELEDVLDVEDVLDGTFVSVSVLVCACSLAFRFSRYLAILFFYSFGCGIHDFFQITFKESSWDSLCILFK